MCLTLLMPHGKVYPLGGVDKVLDGGSGRRKGSGNWYRYVIGEKAVYKKRMMTNSRMHGLRGLQVRGASADSPFYLAVQTKSKRFKGPQVQRA